MPGKLNPAQFPRDESGRPFRPGAVYMVNSDGSFGAQAYSLASNETIPANSAGSVVVRVQRGDYVFDAQFNGTSLVLQSLGADGATWRNVSTLNASGTAPSRIGFGQDTQVRVYNPNGAALTNVYGNIS